MAAYLTSLPPELICRITGSCDDFQQVLALASTCNLAHTIWLENLGTIIWSVARTQIRSFNDALMAVRATAIVLKAEIAGQRPPPIAAQSLSGSKTLPDLSELREVLNMQYLVQCIEWMYFNSQRRYYGDESEADLFARMRYGHYAPERRRFPQCLAEGIPGAENATIDSFRDGFYRAMYRLLLAGAVLAGPYLDPLFRAREEGNDGFFQRNAYQNYLNECWHLIEVMDPSDQAMRDDIDAAYIRKTPMYNFDVEDWSEIGKWRNQEYEAIFGPFASWIVEDGRRRERERRQGQNDIPPDWADSSDDVGAVRELTLLMVAYEHFNGKFENIVRRPRRGPAYLEKKGNRIVSIIRFGFFHVEEIVMPADFDDLIRDDYLAARFHPAFEESAGAVIPYQLDVWHLTSPGGLLKGLGPRWPCGHLRNPENPGPPPMLELWHFALRRYLNLGFRAGLFHMPSRPEYWDSLWVKEVGRGEVFLNPDWAVVQPYIPGTISWA